LRIVYLASTVSDSLWFRRYYRGVFPAGAENARASLRRAEALLAETPLIGRPGDVPGTREFPIRRTPFTFVYRIGADRIEILRILDQRSNAQTG
jgi:plasmid stabilization system protein ParE